MFCRSLLKELNLLVLLAVAYIHCNERVRMNQLSLYSDGYGIDGVAMWRGSVANNAECVLRCLDDHQCFAVNVKEESGKVFCELFDLTSTQCREMAGVKSYAKVTFYLNG